MRIVVHSVTRVDIGGVGLCRLSEAGVVTQVRQAWRSGKGGSIVTANVDIVRASSRDPSLADLVANASLVVADGMPLVWAARLMGERLPERVAGSSLVYSLSEAAAAEGRSVFLLGGDPGIPESAADMLAARIPGLRIAGTAAPPAGFEQTPHGVDEVVRAVVGAAPDLVLVGLGFPKQERMICRLREKLPDAWYLGCGAGIPMAAGQFRRAPVLVQRLGMEWLHRLVLEPRRLARRYLRDDLPFALTLLAVALRRRFAAARRRTPGGSVRTGSAAAQSREPGRPLAVIIVTFHSAAVITACLEALRTALEGVAPARILVVDNASRDGTLDVVARVAPHAEIVRRGSNDGFAAGVNAGLALAPGCDVLVLNPDVQLAPGSVAALRAALEMPGTGIVVPRLTDAGGGHHVSLRRRPTVFRALGEAILGGTRAGWVPALGELVLAPGRYRRGGIVDWATGAAWLISSDCVQALGELDERYFMYSEETDYMLRAADHGFAVRYQPDATAVHLGGEQQSSPWLWALSVTNRVRLHRERRGRAPAMLMWPAVLLGELLRVAGRRGAVRKRHLAAVSALLRMRRWPISAKPGYVCFSAQDWWYHNQAHSDFQLMRQIARNRRVLVLNSVAMRMPLPGRSTQVGRKILRKLRSVAKLVRRPIPELPDFYVMSPLPLPCYSIPWLRRLNAVLVRSQVWLVCRALGLREPIIITTLPTAWDVVRPMRRRALIYNRSDRHSEFPEADRATIESMERDLLGAADHVLYASSALLAEEQILTGARAHFVDHGVDVEHFRPRGPGELPADLAAIPEPRIGFFGALDDFLVDFELLERVAEELPDIALVLIGDSSAPMQRFDRYPNVHYLGYRPYEQIPAYGSGFAVALMPWRNHEWIRHSNPIKLKEYLAIGLPIVSVGFAELINYTDRVRVASSHEDFVAAIRATLDDGGLQTPQQRRASILGASWRARADVVIALAEGTPGRGQALASGPGPVS